MRFVVAGGGFLFYYTTQHIKLDMESKFVQIKRFFFPKSMEFNAFETLLFIDLKGSRLYKGGDPRNL